MTSRLQDWKDEKISQLEDQIERLREDVKFLNSFRPDAALAKGAAEIERLRENKRGWLSANAPGGWIDDLRNEIERLRGLLSEIGKQHRKLAGLVRDAQVPFGTNDALGAIKRCVQEALGE